MAKPEKSLVYALLAVLIWSTVATAFKLGLKQLHYSQLIFIASGISTLFLLGYLIITGDYRDLKFTTRREIFTSAIAGALNPFGYYLILFKAYSLLPAQLAQPLNMIWPITLALLSVPLLGQKIGWRHFLAMGLSFTGIIILSSQGGLGGFKNTNFFGVILAVGSSVFWALYWIINVKDKRKEAIKLFMSFMFGFVYLLIILPFFSGFSFPKGTSLYAAIYVGLFETGITYLIWMKAMQLSNNNAKTGSLIFIAPFISLIFISIILKEKIYSTTITGLILIVSGIVWQQFFIKKV
jgi:drug/metabolite transporter (DMT)-like permease